jgi:cytochrome c553
MRPLVFLAVIALLGCPKKEAAAPPVVVAPTPPPPPADDCTFDTKLVEGVPGSPGHLIPSERNPNGASELATLMRSMVDDFTAAKVKLNAGEPLSTGFFTRHRKLRCAWPTDPKDRTPAFDAMAQAYLAKVKALDAATDKKPAYGEVLGACRSCHEATCSGPIVVIEGLALDAK